MDKDEIKILEKYQLWSKAVKIHRGDCEKNDSLDNATNCSQDSCNCSGCHGCGAGCSSCSG
jgi:hypothetical protein